MNLTLLDNSVTHVSFENVIKDRQQCELFDNRHKLYKRESKYKKTG